jgi:protein OS-9
MRRPCGVCTLFFLLLCYQTPSYAIDTSFHGAIKIIDLSSVPSLSINVREDGDDTESFVIGIADGPSNVQFSDASRNISITASDGEEYLCHIPSATPSEYSNQNENASSSHSAHPSPGQGIESKRKDDEKSPEELLDGLGSWCAYRSEDWWTYELCYKKYARQFHLEGGKAVDQYVLGNFSAFAGDMSAIKVDDAAADGPRKYIEQKYTYGAPCELTGGNRSVDVRFICGKGSQQTTFVEAREPESCRYIFTISTPELCKHSQFQEPVTKFTSITCYPKKHPVGLTKHMHMPSSCRLEDGACSVEGDKRADEEIAQSALYDTSFSDKLEEADVDTLAKKKTGNGTLSSGFEDQEEEQGADGVSIDDLLKNGGYDYEDEQQHYY